MRWAGGVCCVAALVAGSAAQARTGAAAQTAAATGWTGFYAGVGIGARSTVVSWDTVGLNSPGFGFAPFAADNFASLGSTDVRLSGYGGFNYQLGCRALGLEGDVGTATNRTSAMGFPGTGVGFAALAGTDTSRTTFEAKLGREPARPPWVSWSRRVSCSTQPAASRSST